MSSMAIESILAKQAFICDMDGVVYHGNRLLPGITEFVHWVKTNHKKLLFLTNSSERSPLTLQAKLSQLGVEVAVENFYTSALATAAFLQQHNPKASVFVIGEAGLFEAIHTAGLTLNDTDPDFVVMGSSRNYDYPKLEQACLLVARGAKLIGTNPDLADPAEYGMIPGAGALIAPVSLTTGVKPYYIGKPNPVMLQQALRRLGTRKAETALIGDRLDTDILAGIEAELETVLVFSGVAQPNDLKSFSYRPHHCLSGIGDLVP